jgi:aryl-alcohol dehydrogenase-like predicted oxidoreductase
VSLPLRTLGDSGLRVSTLALGTGTFGNQEWGCAENEAGKIYIRYREAGGNFVDTANKYGDGESEAIVGRLTESERDQVVIGTKYTAAHPGTFSDNPNTFGNHAKSLRMSLLRSLERLRTDHVDVLWVHAWDEQTSIVTMMRALDDQVRAGRVLALGASNMPAWVVAMANAIASSRGWTPFTAIQIEYSLIERGAERDLFGMATHLGLATMAWAPLAWGVLTGKYHDETDEPRRLSEDHSKLDTRADAIVREVGGIAADTGHSPSQISLAWVLSRPEHPIALLGARSVSQLVENLEAGDVRLSLEYLARLDQASAIDSGVPNAFLGSPDGLDFFYGSPDIDATHVGAL